MKAPLVANEKWKVLHNLNAARSVVASTVASGHDIPEDDRSSLRRALQALQDLVSADDRPLVLQALKDISVTD